MGIIFEDICSLKYLAISRILCETWCLAVGTSFIFLIISYTFFPYSRIVSSWHIIDRSTSSVCKETVSTFLCRFLSASWHEGIKRNDLAVTWDSSLNKFFLDLCNWTYSFMTIHIRNFQPLKKKGKAKIYHIISIFLISSNSTFSYNLSLSRTAFLFSPKSTEEFSSSFVSWVIIFKLHEFFYFRFVFMFPFKMRAEIDDFPNTK